MCLCQQSKYASQCYHATYIEYLHALVQKYSNEFYILNISEIYDPVVVNHIRYVRFKTNLWLSLIAKTTIFNFQSTSFKYLQS